MSLRIRRRECPILTIGRKIIGRRAHAASINVKIAVGPEVRAAAIGSNGQIVIDADGHPDLARVPLRFGQLFLDDELDVLIEIDSWPVLAREGAASFGSGGMIFLRPLLPGPASAILPVQLLIERAE